MAKRDYYEVLEVSRTATDGEISTSYRKLAIKYHPDSNPGDDEATLKFKECAEAYEVLSDAQKRAAYDQYGHAAFSNGASGGHPGFSNVEDIFSAFGDIFGGGIFEDIFGGGRRRGPRKGEDVRANVTLDLEEAATGTTKTINFNRHSRCDGCQGSGAAKGSSPTTCAQCAGRGRVMQSAGILRVQTTCPACQGAGQTITDPCGDCRGRGFVPNKVTIDVAIPAGVDNGNRVRVSGEGEPSPAGGPPGDCYVFIQVREHQLFERDGEHLILRWPITYSQAVLGATLEIPTLVGGKEELKIPRGTQSGEVFQLRGQGMPDPRGRGRGNLLIQANIDVPKKVSKEQEKLLRELAEVEHTEVSPERKSFFSQITDFFTGATEASEAS